VKGSRLFVRGARDAEDADNVADPGERQLVADETSERQSMSLQTKTHMASASQESREVFRSTQSRNGLKTVHTQRVVRKTTTVTRGEQKQTVSLNGFHLGISCLLSNFCGNCFLLFTLLFSKYELFLFSIQNRFELLNNRVFGNV